MSGTSAKCLLGSDHNCTTEIVAAPPPPKKEAPPVSQRTKQSGRATKAKPGFILTWQRGGNSRIDANHFVINEKQTSDYKTTPTYWYTK